jgi:benzoyl-CoA reductase subunit C
MNSFREILENRHEYAREWKKRTNGRVLGYYDSYFAEEAAYAAGSLPVRILARHEQDDVTDRLMYGNCYYTRDMLNQFIKGRYDYVDGIVSVESCQWLYNAFDTTLMMFPDLFSHYLYTPDYPDGRTSKDVMRSELEIFKKRLENWLGNTVTDGKLDGAIQVYNENRRLLRRLYELRRFDHTALPGSEAMEIVLACQIMDKAEANKMLLDLLPGIEKREPREDRVRLMLTGSETSDVELERLIESLGANVVIDELDNGTGYFWNDVVPLEDRLMAIGLRYMGKPHSALKDNNWRRRLQHIFELTEDYMADGVLVVKQIYCHPHGSDNYAVWKLLRERNIPFHFFERDTTMPVDETRVRLEAFLNMLRPGLTRLRGWNKPLEI